MKRIAIALILAVVPDLAPASVVLWVDNTHATVNYSATTPQTGYFEVYVQSTEIPQPFITFTQVTLSVATPAITFTGLEGTTDHPYIFPDTTGLGGDIQNSGGKAWIQAGDTKYWMSGSHQLADNDGLLRVDFSVAPGTSSGGYTVQVDPSSSQTLLYDDSLPAANVISTVHNGTITISPVPEPASWVAILSGGVVVFGWALYRRRRSKSGRYDTAGRGADGYFSDE